MGIVIHCLNAALQMLVYTSVHGRLIRADIWTLTQVEHLMHDAGGNLTDSDDEADAVDGDGVPLFMWQALGDLGAPMQPQPPLGPEDAEQ